MEAPHLPLPDLLKYLRETAGMTQRGLADRLCAITGTSTVTRFEVGRWEQGRVRPVSWLPALAEALNVPLEVLEQAPDRPRNGKRKSAVIDESDREQVNEVLRRTFLARGAAVVALPVVGVEELQRIAAALEDARHYADGAVVQHFQSRLDEAAEADRGNGPTASIAVVLGAIAAMEQTAREARSNIQRQLLGILARGAELLGWFYRDLAAPAQASYWQDRAMEWAQAGADPAMQGYVLLKKAQAAWDGRDGLRMLSLAQAVLEGPWSLPYQVRAEAAQQVARGRAMLGADRRSVDAEIRRARELLEGEDDRRMSPHYSAALFELQVANTLYVSGRAGQALEIYDQYLTPQAFSRRDYGYFLSSKSAAEVAAGDVDAAALTGLEALRIARETESARTHRSMIRVVEELRPWWSRPTVGELRHALTRS